jgi:spore maturation protein B
MERLPMFRMQPPEAKEGSTTNESPENATPVEDIAIEKVDVPPLHPLGTIALLLFSVVFAAMYFCVAFPETANLVLEAFQRALNTVGIGLGTPWHVVEMPELSGKTTTMRMLLTVSMLAVPFMLSFFPLYAALRKVKVYEQFVEGAKEAFGVGMRIIPFLVAMLVAIRLLRDALVIDKLTSYLAPVLGALRFPGDLLPMVLMRPLSGSGTQGLFVELVQHLGADNIVSRMAATIYGSTETTFYVIAVYFGSVAVRQTRHAILAGLTADTIAVIASITLCRMFFA